MLALFFIVLIIAIAVALAPIILGVIGTMLALLFTALLYLAAGCPKHEAPKPTPAQQAERDAVDAQLRAWEEQDRPACDTRDPHCATFVRERARQERARSARARDDAGDGLLDSQKRVPHSPRGGRHAR